MEKKLDRQIFSKNLKYLRTKSGRTQDELAEILQTTRANITSWEIAKSAPKLFGVYKSIAELFNVSVDDLFFTDLKVKELEIGNHTPNEVQSLTHSNNIIVYGKVCAGDGFEAFEDALDEIINPYPKAKGEFFALQVQGDSMNKVVDDGLYAIIKKSPVVNNGEIAVVLIDHEIGMLKRFYRLDDMVILRPDSTNPEHKPLTFIGEQINEIKILGKFVGFVSPFMD